MAVMESVAQTPAFAELEQHRRELTAHCYRMLGSPFEAEDAVQETLLRAWKSLDRFEGRSSLRSWLYRIATNVCLDQLEGKDRRARPMDFGPAGEPVIENLHTPDVPWLQPVPDSLVADPAETVASRETIRLAFVAALQHLPPKQRAVLILREVLAWKASEVAELLETSVASVNSALQRARATLGENEGRTADTADPLDEEQKKLLERYVAAFEGYDMTALTALLHEDAIMTMPPFDLWLTGHDDITGFMTTLGSACEGSRLLPVQVNGLPGFAQYKPDPENGGYTPWSIQILEISDGRLTGFHFYLDTQRWFLLFDLPLHLDGHADKVEQGA